MKPTKQIKKEARDQNCNFIAMIGKSRQLTASSRLLEWKGFKSYKEVAKWFLKREQKYIKQYPDWYIETLYFVLD